VFISKRSSRRSDACAQARRFRFFAVVAALATGAIAFAAEPFLPAKLAAIDTAVADAIAAKKIPGGVLWFERDGEVYRHAYGHRALVPAPDATTEDTIYDVASLTKVIATTTAVMQLVERGKLDLDAPVAHYLRTFGAHGKDAVTLRHLMTHTSGLRPGIPTTPAWSGYAGAINRACAEELRSVPGSAFVYSDINYIVLGELVRLVSGRTLDVYTREEIFVPLRMSDTGFLPPREKLSRIAPTEIVDGKMIHGVVHDPTSRHRRRPRAVLSDAAQRRRTRRCAHPQRCQRRRDDPRAKRRLQPSRPWLGH
jgi:CubicO group peptidase (beta-lactamase class C family)